MMGETVGEPKVKERIMGATATVPVPDENASITTPKKLRIIHVCRR
jgi:hypothetical protein